MIWRLKALVAVMVEFLVFMLLPFGGTAAEFWLWWNGSGDQEGAGGG